MPPPAQAQAAPTPKPRIEKAADLPRFSYKLAAKVEDVVRSAEQFAPFAAQLRRDTESVLTGYDIADKATQRDLIGQLAALDFLEGNFDSATVRAAQVRSLQDKPADKLLSGIRLRAMARAAAEHGLASPAYPKTVADLIARELAPLPRPVIENDIREAKAGLETLGEGLLVGRLREVVQPIVNSNGSLSSDFAPGLVSTRLALVAVLPIRQALIDTYSAYLAAGKVDKPDIWAAREVTLPATPARAPVPIAVWDSGSDTQLFTARLQRDKSGKAALIAFDKYSRPAAGDLMPIPTDLRNKLPQMRARTKGFSDLQSNLDSAEASEVKRWLSGLPAEQYKPALEELGLATSYEHGTHVAGIAMAGNPHARLIVGRISFSHTLKPDPCPSPEQTERDAKAYRAYVDFFRQQGARVVNMSWGGSVGAYENDLEQCGIGKTPEERKEVARAYFELAKRALTRATDPLRHGGRQQQQRCLLRRRHPRRHRAAQPADRRRRRSRRRRSQLHQLRPHGEAARQRLPGRKLPARRRARRPFGHLDGGAAGREPRRQAVGTEPEADPAAVDQADGRQRRAHGRWAARVAAPEERGRRGGGRSLSGYSTLEAKSANCLNGLRL